MLFLLSSSPWQDFFTALAAFTGTTTNDSLGIGAIVGAGFFITSFVLGSVGLTQEFTVHRRPFARDVLMYLGSMMALFAFVSDGEVPVKEKASLRRWGAAVAQRVPAV